MQANKYLKDRTDPLDYPVIVENRIVIKKFGKGERKRRQTPAPKAHNLN